MRHIVVKEGPLVLVQRLIFAEILSTIIFYGISFLENFEEFFHSSSFSTILRYDILLMLSFSIFQIFLIMTLFVYWYFSYVEIGKEEVVKVFGIIKRRRISYLLNKLQSIEIDQGLLQMKMRHATLSLIFDGGRKLKLKNISSFGEAKDFLNFSLEENNKNKTTFENIISEGEGEKVEFKETLRHDILRNVLSKDIEKATLKTVAGFLNARGGTLFLGVDDKGTLKGLKRDYETLKRQNKDGFENHLKSLLEEHVGELSITHTRILFESKEENDICVVEVLPSHKPVFLKHEGKEEFFVRTGNKTKPLSMSEAQNYIKDRF